MMSEDEKKLFDDTIKHSKNYLEYGLGGTTLRSIQKSGANIFSVDTSEAWIEYMRQYLIIKKNENKRLSIFYLDIGPTRQFGYPVSTKNKSSFPLYSSDIFKRIDKDIIDLVMIDGRFRVACTLKIIIECYSNPELRILFHDFWDRPQYHILLKYLDTIDAADTLGLFSIKKAPDPDELAQDYDNYKYNPF